MLKIFLQRFEYKKKTNEFLGVIHSVRESFWNGGPGSMPGSLPQWCKGCVYNL